MRSPSFQIAFQSISRRPARKCSVAGVVEECDMKQHRTRLPTRLEAGGFCIQAQDWADLNVARIRLPKGADATPLLAGMPDNLCQCPHWGMVLTG